MTNHIQINRVVGFPLTHSQSPLLHQTIYRLLNYPAAFVALAEKDIAKVINVMKATEGLTAVTMPFKEKVLPFLDSLHPAVQSLRAVNTVICRGGKLYGYNTDIDGIAYALRDVQLVNKTALIIGAGGAARALAYYLQQNNVNLLWLNRTAKHVVSLIEMFGGTLINRDDLNYHSIDLFINTTPLGMFPAICESPLLNYQFNTQQIIFDMVYQPIKTTLLNQAEAQGATIISGLDMFIAQGIKQVELWLNKSIIHNNLIPILKHEIINNRG